MRFADIRRMSTFFGRLTELQRYMLAMAAAVAEHRDCDCLPDGSGRHQLAGRCAAAAQPSEHCRSVIHVVARTALHQLNLPGTHLTDEQLVAAIAGLAALVDRAPEISEREFVEQMQQLLHATPAPDAAPSEEPPA